MTIKWYDSKWEICFAKSKRASAKRGHLKLGQGLKRERNLPYSTDICPIVVVCHCRSGPVALRFLLMLANELTNETRQLWNLPIPPQTAVTVCQYIHGAFLSSGWLQACENGKQKQKKPQALLPIRSKTPVSLTLSFWLYPLDCESLAKYWTSLYSLKWYGLQQSRELKIRSLQRNIRYTKSLSSSLFFFFVSAFRLPRL